MVVAADLVCIAGSAASAGRCLAGGEKAAESEGSLATVYAVVGGVFRATCPDDEGVRGYGFRVVTIFAWESGLRRR